MKTALASAMGACLCLGCGLGDSHPSDACNEEARSECFHLLRQCGLTGSDPEWMLNECKPWIRCEQAALDDCWERHTS